MIVIFAGCDCAGKSTCFNMMNKDAWIMKKGVASANLNADIETLKSELLSNKSIVYDRIPVLDDFVYSHVFSHRDSELISRVEEVSTLLSKCVIIYFDCDNGEIIRRMNKRGDDYVSEDQIPIIKSEYENTFKLLNIEPHRINTTYVDPTDVFIEAMGVIYDEKYKNR